MRMLKGRVVAGCFVGSRCRGFMSWKVTCGRLGESNENVESIKRMTCTNDEVSEGYSGR
jgi:hypothetical protein